jgi:hypothetical protein
MTISLARNVGNLGNVLSTSGKYATQATPPALDSSSNLSTTGFVKASGHTYSNIFLYSVSSALPTAQLGGIIEVTASGLTLTLPPVGTAPTGATITFLNPLATGNVTLKGNSSDVITSPFSTSGVNTFTLYPNESLDLVSTSSNWVVVKYAQLNAPAFSSPTASTTPGHFDSSTLIPNTSWHSLRGSAFNSSTTSVSATSTTLTAGNVGGAYYFNASASQTVAMPPSTGITVGSTLTFFTASATTLTVNGSGTNLDLGNGLYSTFQLPPANSITFIFASSASWMATGVYPFNRNYIASTVTNINTSISNEATARNNEDVNLQNQITNLAGALNTDVGNLSTDINNESTNRVNGDNNLQNQINAIKSVYGIGSYYFIQQSQWSGGFGPGGTGTISGVPGSWEMTSATQISGDNVGLGYRYA